MQRALLHAILCTTIYCLLGELGAAGLRAPPECVVDPQPDLDNASEGNAVMTATLLQRLMRHSPFFACMSELPLLAYCGGSYVTGNPFDDSRDGKTEIE